MLRAVVYWLAYAGVSPSAPGEDLLTLEWDAPPECPDVEAVRSAVDRRTDTASLEAPVSVRGRVVRMHDEYTVRLEVFGRAQMQSRTIGDPDCSAVAEAVAVVVAIAVRTERHDGLEPAPSTDVEPATPNAAQAPDRRAPLIVAPPPVASHGEAIRPPSPPTMPPAPVAPRGRGRWQLGGRLAAGAGFGALPTLAPDLSADLWTMRNRVRLDVLAHWQSPRSARYTEQPGAGAEISRWAIGVQPCGVPRRRAWELPLCAGVEFGGMVGQGVNLTLTRRAHVPWGAVIANVGAERRLLPWLGVSAVVGGHLAFIRPAFVGDTLGRVHRARRFGVTASVGVTLRWPRRLGPAAK